MADCLDIEIDESTEDWIDKFVPVDCVGGKVLFVDLDREIAVAMWVGDNIHWRGEEFPVRGLMNRKDAIAQTRKRYVSIINSMLYQSKSFKYSVDVLSRALVLQIVPKTTVDLRLCIRKVINSEINNSIETSYDKFFMQVYCERTDELLSDVGCKLDEIVGGCDVNERRLRVYYTENGVIRKKTIDRTARNRRALGSIVSWFWFRNFHDKIINNKIWKSILVCNIQAVYMSDLVGKKLIDVIDTIWHRYEFDSNVIRSEAKVRELCVGSNDNVYVEFTGEIMLNGAKYSHDELLEIIKKDIRYARLIANEEFSKAFTTKRNYANLEDFKLDSLRLCNRQFLMFTYTNKR